MDPNEIVRPGTPETAWITPDGKYITTDPDEAKANGATHQVSAANVVFADGRKQWIVFNGADRSLAPGTYSPAGPQMGYDKEQQARWQQQQSATTRGDQEGDTRGPQTGQTREVYRGGKWVVEPNPLYQPSGSTTKEWRTEGTPLPGGGYDNSNPIMAAYVNGQRTGETRQPTAKELEDWNLAGQMTRNPGGKTDAEIKAEAEKNKPGAPTLKPDGKGGTIAVQTMPDGTIKTTPLPGVPSEVSSKYKEVKQDPKTGKWSGLTPDGKWEEIAGGPGLPSKGGKLPPGVNPPRFSRGNVAAELNRFNRELDQAVARGEITKEEAVGFYTPYHQEASTYISEQNNADSQDNNAVSSALTQRSQNLTQSGNRLNWANSAFQNAAQQDNNLLMGAAGTGKSALVPLLTLQAGLANAAGGFRDQPEVEIRRYPAMGAGVPASIAPVINATNAAPSGVAAGMSAPPRTASPDAAAEAARQQQAASGGAATATPALAPPPPVAGQTALPRDAQGNAPQDPPLNIVNRKTGERRQIKLSEINALPDRADWDVEDPNGTGTVTAAPSAPNYRPEATTDPAVTPLAPAQMQPPTPPVHAKPDFGSPDMTVTPMAPPAGAPVGPATGAGGNVQMMPRSIQPAMPQQPQAPDIEALTAQMLADGVDPTDVMEVRRRWSRSAA